MFTLAFFSKKNIGDNSTDYYIVSGAGSFEYDGTYTYLDEYNGYPRYSCLGADGSTMMYMQYNTNMDAYIISAMGNTAYLCAGRDIGNSWTVGTANAPAPTVTKGNNVGGDTPDVPNTPNKNYVYTVSGAGTTEVNGDYWDTGELIEGYPSYENANGVKIYCIVAGGIGKWIIKLDSAGGDHFYSSYWNGDTVYNPLEECIYWRIIDGSAPAPTVTAYRTTITGCAHCNSTDASILCTYCQRLICEECMLKLMSDPCPNI